jgi:hypothetical protein
MKVIGWIIAVVVLVLVALGVFVYLKSEDLVASGIETYGSRYLEADVSVSQVNLSLTEGSGEILGLDIGNPRGFGGGSAFALGQIKVVVDPQQTSGELIVLKEVIVDAAEIGAVVRGQHSNLQALMDNLDRNVGGEETTAPADEAAGPKLIIDRFRFTNARASVDSDIAGQMQVSVPDVYLEDIGRSSNGATVGAALQQLLEPVIRAVTREMLERGLDLEGVRSQVEDSIRDKVTEKLGSGLKGLTDKLGTSEKE